LAGIEGICNGTTNYILTRLANENSSFETVLADAQDAGFAETDPTMDIDGFDSKFKLQILLLHSFGILTTPDDILNIGIRHIKEEDIILAKEKGLKIKLISFARKIENKVVAFVAPVLVNKSSFAYDINYEFNSVSIEALFSDKQVFIGKGAGSFPTASAVLSDISALQYGYNYEYKKLFNSNVQLAEDFEVSVFISANSVNSLDKIKFNSVEEEYTSSQFVYKIGRLNRFILNQALYREHPDLFIAFIPDANLTLKTGTREKKVVELIN
jgi:homoserine dehydrogenase